MDAGVSLISAKYGLSALCWCTKLFFFPVQGPMTSRMQAARKAFPVLFIGFVWATMKLILWMLVRHFLTECALGLLLTPFHFYLSFIILFIVSCLVWRLCFAVCWFNAGLCRVWWALWCHPLVQKMQCWFCSNTHWEGLASMHELSGIIIVQWRRGKKLLAFAFAGELHSCAKQEGFANITVCLCGFYIHWLNWQD